jgi:cyanophycin synthetase
MDDLPADPVTSGIWALGAMGRSGRELAVRLDTARSIGVRRAWRRLREDGRLSKLGAFDAGPAYRRIWGEAASELGAEIHELSGGFLEIRKGKAATRVWNHWVMLDDVVTLRLALDKRLVHQLLTSARLPVPEHVEFDTSNLAPASSFLESSVGLHVVKPARSSGGSGVTGGVRHLHELRRAALRASRFDSRILIERQATGFFYRLLFMHGRLLDVVRRLPPSVTGDGHSTIAELMEAESHRRIASHRDRVLSLLRPNLDCVLTLKRANLTLDSILPSGATVAVKTVNSRNRIEDNETVREMSDELVAEAAAAVDTVGLRLAGVDVITADPMTSLAASGGVIVEVNGTPGLHYHYDVADRAAATPVAVRILSELLE